MKKHLLLVLCLICTTVFTQAQTLKTVAESENMTWYGVDYSEARFMNFGAYLSDEGVKKSLNRWSFDPFGGDDIKHWSKKYKKDNLKVDLETSHKRNHNTDFTPHLSNDPFEMSKEDIAKMVAEYNIQGDYYGLLFIAESFNNAGAKEAKMWAVVINEKDGSVIDAERFTIETFGDWAEGVRLGVRQSARHMSKAK